MFQKGKKETKSRSMNGSLDYVYHVVIGWRGLEAYTGLCGISSARPSSIPAPIDRKGLACKVRPRPERRGRGKARAGRGSGGGGLSIASAAAPAAAGAWAAAAAASAAEAASPQCAASSRRLRPPDRASPGPDLGSLDGFVRGDGPPLAGLLPRRVCGGRWCPLPGEALPRWGSRLPMAAVACPLLCDGRRL